MRRLTRLALCLGLAIAGPALADPGPDWLTPAQAKAALRAAGYSEITKLEADDGHWDGEGVKEGKTMRFEADPKTGAILGEMAAE